MTATVAIAADVIARRIASTIDPVFALIDGWRDALEATLVGSSRVDLQACKLEYSIVSPK